MQVENLSVKLRNLRETSGFSQGQIANKLFISRAAYSHYETGKRLPTLENILQLSSIYNINPAELLKSLIQRKSIISTESIDFKELSDYTQTLNKTNEFVTNFNKLGQKERDLIISMTNMLSNRNNY